MAPSLPCATPTSANPSPDTLGTRPVAYSTVSTVRRCPCAPSPASWTSSPSGACVIWSTSAQSLRSIPAFCISAAMKWRTSSSKPRNTGCPRYNCVTLEPRPLKMEANSQAM